MWYWKSNHSNQTRDKRNSNRKEVKPSLFSDDMILSIKNPKDITKILLELIMNLVKLQNTKLTYRNVTFPYTNYQEEEFKKLSNLQSHQKEYIGLNLIKEVKACIFNKTSLVVQWGCVGSIPGQGTKIPYDVWHGQEKNKAALRKRKKLMKEIKDDTNRWKETVLVNWKNTVKTTILLHTIYIFKAIPIKTPMAFPQN